MISFICYLDKPNDLVANIFMVAFYRLGKIRKKPKYTYFGGPALSSIVIYLE
jgi:hypothetical protein